MALDMMVYSMNSCDSLMSFYPVMGFGRRPCLYEAKSLQTRLGTVHSGCHAGAVLGIKTSRGKNILCTVSWVAMFRFTLYREEPWKIVFR